MPSDAPLVEVNVADLTRSEWTKIVWGVLWRGSRYTLPPLVAVVVTVAVFGMVVAAIWLSIGFSPETLAQYELVFDIVGDLLSAAIGVYVFARNLRTLPRVQVGAYRFALVRNDTPLSATRSAG
jgi:hypothetical protein